MPSRRLLVGRAHMLIQIDHARARNHIRDSRIARLSIRLGNRERGFFGANSYSGFVRINRGPVGRFSLRTSRSLLSFSSLQDVFALPDRPDFGYHFFEKKMIWAILPCDLTPFSRPSSTSSAARAGFANRQVVARRFLDTMN